MDLISILMSSLKNGSLAKKPEVSSPYFKFGEVILDFLVDEGFIHGFSISYETGNPTFVIYLKYYKGEPVFKTYKRYSKSSNRVYSDLRNLYLNNTYSSKTVISTPKGLFFLSDLFYLGLGGEVLFDIN